MFIREENGVEQLRKSDARVEGGREVINGDWLPSNDCSNSP